VTARYTIKIYVPEEVLSAANSRCASFYPFHRVSAAGSLGKPFASDRIGLRSPSNVANATPI